MSQNVDSRQRRARRHDRVRKKVTGTPERPRLSVFRSLNHIAAQVIDDSKGQTLAAASTYEPEVRNQGQGQAKTAQAQRVGALVAQRALALGITQVVFDRGGYRYHGRVKALAEAARKGGMVF